MVSIGEVYLEISASKKKELATTLLPTNFNREKRQFNRGKGFARVGEPDLALKPRFSAVSVISIHINITEAAVTLFRSVDRDVLGMIDGWLCLLT